MSPFACPVALSREGVSACRYAARPAFLPAKVSASRPTPYGSSAHPLHSSQPLCPLLRSQTRGVAAGGPLAAPLAWPGGCPSPLSFISLLTAKEGEKVLAGAPGHGGGS
jgi:hypothetical protein